jgi:hypothetical protein
MIEKPNHYHHHDASIPVLKRGLLPAKLNCCRHTRMFPPHTHRERPAMNKKRERK